MSLPHEFVSLLRYSTRLICMQGRKSICGEEASVIRLAGSEMGLRDNASFGMHAVGGLGI